MHVVRHPLDARGLLDGAAGLLQVLLSTLKRLDEAPFHLEFGLRPMRLACLLQGRHVIVVYVGEVVELFRLGCARKVAVHDWSLFRRLRQELRVDVTHVGGSER